MPLDPTWLSNKCSQIRYYLFSEPVLVIILTYICKIKWKQLNQADHLCSAMPQIQKIRIGHDGSKPGSGWFLDEVRIDIPSKGEHYLFACHRWLDTKEEDGEIEIELDPTDFREGSVRMYMVVFCVQFELLM